MLFRVLVFVSASLAVFPACAVAATVSPTAGEVRIGSGRGYQQIVAPTEVAAGAQILVSPQGAASIAYSDDCVVPVPAAAITIVESQSPCASLPEPSYFGFAQSNQEGFGIEGDPFGFTPKVDAPEKDDSPAPSSGKKKKPATVDDEDERPSDHGLLIVGGVVVGAGILAAVLASQGGDQPASP